MNRKRKADPVKIGFKSKTNFTGGEIKGFSMENSTTNLEHIAPIIARSLGERLDWKRQKPGRIKSL
jgi:hypothetical protein